MTDRYVVSSQRWTMIEAIVSALNAWTPQTRLPPDA